MSSLSSAFSSLSHPVSDSSLLRAVNSDANDALLVYAKHYGKISDATSAIMTSIDLQGFQLRVTFRNPAPANASAGGNGNTPLSPTNLRTSAVTTVKIQFKQALSLIDDAPTALTDMYLEARAAVSPSNANQKPGTSGPLLERRFYNAFVLKPILCFVLIFGLYALYVIGFYSVSELPLPFLFLPIRSLGYFIFRTQFLLKLAHYAAWIGHSGEAIYAYILLKQMKMDGNLVDTIKWVGQTFILGFPSLTILIKMKRQFKKQQNPKKAE